MLRAVLTLIIAAATVIAVPADGSGYDDTGRVAWVTDGDTFRLASGERIRIARIDAPETHREQARCAAEVQLGLRAKDRVTALLAGREIRFRRVGRSYNRKVATVALNGEDVAAELVRAGIAAWWPRGRPKSDWCHQGR